MKKLLSLISLIVLVMPCDAQQLEKVSPIYGSDDQANQMIKYISENLTLEIPAGYSTKNVNGFMSCKLSIDPSGKIDNIDITKSATRWLDIVIVEGLRKIPPSTMWTATKTRTLKRQLIFTFGGYTNDNPFRPPGVDKDAINQQIDAAVNDYKRKQQDSINKHWAAWDGKTKLDTKIDMPLTPDKNRPHSEIKTDPIKPNVDIPRIEISLGDIVE